MKQVAAELSIIFTVIILFSAMETYGFQALAIFVAGLMSAVLLVAIVLAVYHWAVNSAPTIAGYVRKIRAFAYTLLGTAAFPVILNWMGFHVVGLLLGIAIQMVPGLTMFAATAWFMQARPWLLTGAAFLLFCLVSWFGGKAEREANQSKTNTPE